MIFAGALRLIALAIVLGTALTLLARSLLRPVLFEISPLRISRTPARVPALVAARFAPLQQANRRRIACPTT